MLLNLFHVSGAKMIPGAGCWQEALSYVDYAAAGAV